MALLTFIGAIQEVTGSCYLLETRDGMRVLLECGMRQGRSASKGTRDNEASNAAPFPFDPKQLDAVVISHAHLDHSGLLPRLAKEGYSGPIYATESCCDLLELMLMDSAHIQEKDAEWENKWRARLNRPPVKPLYTLEDASRALNLRRRVSYGSTVEVARGIRVTFHNAGHILGSAIVEIEIHEFGLTRRLVFSGDLGSTCSPLMRTPTPLNRADVVLLESTYGDRDHRDGNETLLELAGILEQAQRDGGNVLIPSFAVGRTQDLLYYLGRFYQEGRLPQKMVYLDSPMAAQANNIYLRHANEFADADREYIRGTGTTRLDEWLPILRTTQSVDESMALNRIQSGAIIIAGSGMCTGGRIVHHLKHNLWREECHIVFPGFQAKGTLGRAIVDGAETVRILRQRISVRAKIHTLGGFSAHAGQSQLIQWVGHFEHKPELYLIHGEREKMDALQKALGDRLGWNANIPEPGDRIAI
ncbi:MBL fold metallo-hydrolase [Pseudomonas sp. ZM23]|uniref:MBL fold metallo-hydrolase n=1 Tax=Pseudomonas triclosanedens TaxID=2961893 RepID=A0ABY6ZU31_9PSED|nr:MBL fold metallo-hydrolase [Pseudomonas triclosanedens]MCP8463569.1 MBL fold metallo-hydrolase [Pseudomonas triclosanedens]MCP8469372.1 MBL fold metallo-hydrolase [Pseudomonas triclosanedens]MCP8474370.1 MBL fold metallo-hydrolase [Pseudomonas triclosanedens]WAI48245.1 MBL fold metallo-hydrolase [Pseudomonas triclosanedens]